MSDVEPTRSLPQATDERSAAPQDGVREIGPYVVSGEIGRGGLGRVLEAWDTRLGRPVALKEPLHGGRIAQIRFAREARITARLQHPGVVPIYEAGETPEGEPYYAMRFVAGRSLRELIEEHRTLDARLALLPAVLAAADTVAYAHSRAIVHRDLKPANVLVGAFGETVVIDWGLGKNVDDPDDADADAELERACDSEITAAGSVLGTPAFMPPEQAAGDAVDLRADVYALGAILYHVLAGVAPYAGTTEDGIAAVRRGPPRELIELEPAAPRDLVAIVDQAMARDRDARYPTAAQLADDLRRFQTGQLVRAHRYSRLALAERWIRRHARWTALAVLAVLGALGAGQILSARRSADSSQQLADTRGRESRRRADALLVGDAARLLSSDPARAIAGLVGYPLDGADWARIEDMAVEAARLGLPDCVAHVGDGAAAALSPDGAVLAVATPRAVRVLDAATCARRRDWQLRLEPFEEIASASWLSSDLLLVALRGGGLIAFDGHGDRRDVPCARAVITAVAAAPSLAVVAADDGSVTACTLAGGRVELARHKGSAAGVAIAGSRAMSIGRDGALAAAALDGSRRARRDLGAGGLAMLAARVAGGRIDLAIGTDAGDLLLVDGTTLAVRRRLQHFDARFEQLAWLAGADALIVATTDQVVRTVRVADGVEVHVAAGYRFAQSPAGDWIAVATNGQVTLYDPRTAWRRTITAHAGAVQALALTRDGRIATVGADGTLRLWGRAHRPERLYAFEGVGAYLDSVPGRDDFAIASETGQLQLCRPTGACLEARLPDASPALVRLGATSEPIAAADLGRGVIHLFDGALASLGRIEIGEPLRDVRTTGTRMLVVARGGALYLGDARDRHVARLAVAGCPQVIRARWLPDQRALLACRDGTVLAFDLATRTVRWTAWIAGAAIAGTGSLRDGSVLALLESGDLRRLGSAPGLLFGCAEHSSRLFEASDGGAWVADCGARVRVVNELGAWTESPELVRGGSGVADMDARSDRSEVAIGSIDRLVLWNHVDATIKIAGSSLAVYNVEVGDSAERVITASSPGSVQLWDLSGAPALPTDNQRLAGWISALANRYRFEDNQR